LPEHENDHSPPQIFSIMVNWLVSQLVLQIIVKASL